MRDGDERIGALTLKDLWDRSIWVAWQTELIGGRKAKAPYAATGTAYAKSDDPATWGTRIEAAERAARLTRPEGLGGVGVMFTEIEPGLALGGIDLDACREPVSGTLAPWAQEIVDRFATYTEVSPSNIGVKLFFLFEIGPVAEAGVRGKTVRRKGDNDRLKDPGIEFYIEKRYFTVTDQQCSATDDLRVVTIEDLRWLIEVAIPAFSSVDGPKMTREKHGDRVSTVADPIASMIDDVREALELIPNPDLHWDRWSEIGMAVYRATEGSAEGYAAFVVWSQKASVYDEEACKERWEHWGRSPPDRTGARSLYYWANQADPGWVKPSERSALPDESQEALALAFAEAHVRDLRFTHALNKWHEWDGTRWRPDETLSHFDHSRKLCREAAVAAPTRLKKEVASASTVAAVVKMARADPRLATAIDAWDRDPWLLGTPGGTVDLRTGETRPADPDDMMTKSTVAAPGGEVAGSRWESFVLEVCRGDAELAGYLKRLAGYCLTGLTREEKLFFFVGGGGNGKSVFIEAIAHAMGDYATTVAMGTLVQTKYQEHPTEIAKLHGIRFAVASESEEGARWNVARIKALTGGDRVTGRFMRADFFDFTPTHKFSISSNKKPALGTVDRAIARRLDLIPFEADFAGREDVTLKERFRNEAGIILAWAIDGCIEWQRVGLGTPASVLAATEEYLNESDDTSQFLADTTTPATRAERVAVPTLYRLFGEWCARNGAPECSKIEFTRRLERRGIHTERQGRTTWAYGVTVAAETGAEPGELFDFEG